MGFFSVLVGGGGGVDRMAFGYHLANDVTQT